MATVDLDLRTWREHAVCRGRLDLFFAPVAERPPARARRQAEGRSLCARCPVSRPCREDGRRHAELGLWGGETEAERVDAGFLAAP